MDRKTNGAMRRRQEKEVTLTPESIDGYLEHLRSVGRVQGTLDSYRRKIGRLYQTLPEEETFFEAHRKYLDIHLMLRGSERVEIAPPECLTEFDRVEENDFYAYRGQGDYKLTLTPGNFLVVFPGDAHRIKMRLDSPETVSKVVFKVKIYD